jgi:hypothetical protein
MPYPCTCLCFGSALQITRTLPLRRMTWQLPQILLTLALTFTARTPGGLAAC